jgi:hypothetical protein
MNISSISLLCPSLLSNRRTTATYARRTTTSLPHACRRTSRSYHTAGTATFRLRNCRCWLLCLLGDPLRVRYLPLIDNVASSKRRRTFPSRHPTQELIALCDDSKALMCVHHDYKPTETSKLRGCEQALYPRKNWSSCFLINCGHPANAACTLEMLNHVRSFLP